MVAVYLFIPLCIGLSCLFTSKTGEACTLPSYMTGTWNDNRYLKVDFWGSSEMYLHEYSISRRGSSTNMTCYMNSGNKYIMRTTSTIRITISGTTDDYYFFLCMEITQLTSYSFYYYLQSNLDTNSERTVASTSAAPAMSDICQTTIAPELFQVMVREDYETSAVQQCSTPFLGEFSFSFEPTIGSTSSGNFSSCTTLTRGNITYASVGIIKVGFSGNGDFGCVASIQSENNYYAMWYNFDATIDSTLTYRFSCVVASYSGTNVNASQRARVCYEGQSASSKPTDVSVVYPSSTGTTPGGFLQLTPFYTCVPSDDSGLSAGVIAAIVIIILLIIGGIVGGLLFYFFYYKPKQAEKRKLLEEKKKPRSHIGMMKKAVEAGVGGGIHNDDRNRDIINMVDMEEDGIEGAVTGINPDKFREHNNNMKVNGKFVASSSSVNRDNVHEDFDAPNFVPESTMNREKSKVTSGFSANMSGTVKKDTPNTPRDQNEAVSNGNAINQNGFVPNGNVNSQNGFVPNGNTNNQNGIVPNGNVPTHLQPTEAMNKPVNGGVPITTTTATSQNNISGIQREKSMNGGPINNTAKTTVASVNPYTEEKPKILQDDPKPTDRRNEDKLRKSVSFAGDKPPPSSNATAESNSTNNKASLPGTVAQQPDPIITLPREPSNLMGPRDTTLPEIDLKNF